MDTGVGSFGFAAIAMANHAGVSPLARLVRREGLHVIRRGKVRGARGRQCAAGSAAWRQVSLDLVCFVDGNQQPGGDEHRHVLDPHPSANSLPRQPGRVRPPVGEAVTMLPTPPGHCLRAGVRPGETLTARRPNPRSGDFAASRNRYVPGRVAVLRPGGRPRPAVRSRIRRGGSRRLSSGFRSDPALRLDSMNRTDVQPGRRIRSHRWSPCQQPHHDGSVGSGRSPGTSPNRSNSLGTGRLVRIARTPVCRTARRGTNSGPRPGGELQPVRGEVGRSRPVPGRTGGRGVEGHAASAESELSTVKGTSWGPESGTVEEWKSFPVLVP